MLELLAQEEREHAEWFHRICNQVDLELPKRFVIGLRTRIRVECISRRYRKQRDGDENKTEHGTPPVGHG